jgi:hypothetical protein
MSGYESCKFVITVAQLDRNGICYNRWYSVRKLAIIEANLTGVFVFAGSFNGEQLRQY